MTGPQNAARLFRQLNAMWSLKRATIEGGLPHASTPEGSFTRTYTPEPRPLESLMSEATGTFFSGVN